MTGINVTNFRQFSISINYIVKTKFFAKHSFWSFFNKDRYLFICIYIYVSLLVLHFWTLLRTIWIAITQKLKLKILSFQNVQKSVGSFWKTHALLLYNMFKGFKSFGTYYREWNDKKQIELCSTFLYNLNSIISLLLYCFVKFS